jgi:hypothetical protein
MDIKVRELDEDKLFKIAKLSLKGKAQDWYYRLDPPLNNWKTLQALLHLKYGVYDEDELRMKMDVVHHEPRQSSNCTMTSWNDFLLKVELWMLKDKGGF